MLSKREIEARLDWLSTLMRDEVLCEMDPALYPGQIEEHRAERRRFRAAEAAVARRIGATLGPLRGLTWEYPEWQSGERHTEELLRLPVEYQSAGAHYHDIALAYALDIPNEWAERAYP